MYKLANDFRRPPDFEGTVRYAKSGGRHSPAFSGYRPAHKLHDNYLSSGFHEYLDVDSVMPGEEARVAVWLITPEVYPACLWEGREIEVFEGQRQVGTLRVDRLLNEILRCSPESYRPEWISPPGLEQ